jgi:hypothetical protein
VTPHVFACTYLAAYQQPSPALDEWLFTPTVVQSTFFPSRSRQYKPGTSIRALLHPISTTHQPHPESHTGMVASRRPYHRHQVWPPPLVPSLVPTSAPHRCTHDGSPPPDAAPRCWPRTTGAPRRRVGSSAAARIARWSVCGRRAGLAGLAGASAERALRYRVLNGCGGGVVGNCTG